jgi:hypothetical protein
MKIDLTNKAPPVCVDRKRFESAHAPSSSRAVAAKAPPDERGGNSYVQPTAAATSRLYTNENCGHASIMSDD